MTDVGVSPVAGPGSWPRRSVELRRERRRRLLPDLPGTLPSPNTWHGVKAEASLVVGQSAC